MAKRKGNNIDHPSAEIEKVEVPKKSPEKTIIPESNSDVDSSDVKEKDGEKTECISGFIFMCNPSTKLECYQYRVFGLPFRQKEVVEKIKPGAKLFLYDFGLKLLYGVYMATSAGDLNLEPAAFGGKYPAQIKFKIFKECLPMPESSLRHVIKENYTGSKFNQELSNKQVKKLLSSFRPLFGSSYIPVPQMLANASLSRAMPLSEIQNQFKHKAVMEVPHIPETQYNRTRPLVESQTVPTSNYLHQGYYRPAPPYVEHVLPTLDHCSLPSTSSYYVASSQVPSFPGGANHAVQESPYSRYRPMDGRTPLAQVTSLERYRTMQERGSCGEVKTQSVHYVSSTAAHAPHISGSVSQPCVPAYAYTNATAAAQYPSASVSQPCVPSYAYSYAAGAQYPSESVSQSHVPAYTYSAAASAQHPNASVSQPYVPAYPYYDASVSQPYVPEYVPASGAEVTAQYTNASFSTQWPQAGVAPHAPITSYYSYPH